MVAGDYIAVFTNPHKIKQVTCFLDESVIRANENLYPILEEYLKDLLQWPEGSVSIYIAELAGKNWN